MADGRIVSLQPYHGREVAVYRASSLHACPNALLAARLELDPMSPPEWLQKRFNAGHHWEDIILAELRADFGFHPYGAQEVVELPVGKGALIRGHLDAINPAGDLIKVSRVNGEPGVPEIDLHDIIVMDAKALAPSTFESWTKKNWAAHMYYAWQQAFYCDAVGAQGVVMAVKNKVDDELLVDYYDREHIPVTQAQIIGKVLQIEKLAEQGEPALFSVPCPEPKPYPCPYFHLHEADKKKEVTAPEDFDGDLGVLVKLATKRDRAAATEKKAKTEKEAAEQEIRTLVGKVASLTLDDYTVTTYHHVSSGADWDGIADALGLTAAAVKEKYTSQNTSEKLSVKVTANKKKKAS